MAPHYLRTDADSHSEDGSSVGGCAGTKSGCGCGCGCDSFRGGLNCISSVPLCCQGLCWLVVLIGAVSLALRRNYSCNAGALEGVVPPYGGELMPPSVILKERINQYGFQLTKLVDVYDATDDTHIGYFYDMNFFWFMRFGFSDAKDRIWFEAKRPWFNGAKDLTEWWYRAVVYGSQHYQLERCDDGVVGRLGGIYHIDEDTTVRPWWCKEQCMKILDVTRDSEDQVLPPAPMANVHFNYTLEWYYGGFETRQAWNMFMTEPGTGATIASAHQYFEFQELLLGGNMYISRWRVDVKIEEPALPNWFIVFMAALDDIDESGTEKDR